MKLVAIADNTFREAVRQPFYLLVLVLVFLLLFSHYFLPFFTLGQGQDLLMFKDVCLAYILIGLLVMTLLLASKVVDEEIVNRTTLTLMSKPVRRWELIVGKFLGVMAAVTLALAALAVVLSVATWMRVPSELRIDPQTWDEEQVQKLADARHMHTMSLLPGYALIWLQIAVMTAVAVAISTRAGLVVTMVAGIGVYVAAHLTPFIPAGPGRIVAVVLPYLENFNLNELIVYRTIIFGDGQADPDRLQVAYSRIWVLVGWSALYAAGYVTVALLGAMALFRSRELG